MGFPLLSAKLIELRNQYGYSQQEIANYLGLTREGYSHYERSAREPSLEVLVKLCRLYRIDISDLINENTILNIPLETTKNEAITSKSFSTIASTTYATGITFIPPASIAMGAVRIPPDFIDLTISKNLNHFLKLLTGTNSTLDFTNITKEDFALLAQYKKLDKESQKEVREFIKFKRSLKKKNKQKKKE